MGDGVFNSAKGRVVEFYNRVKSNDPANSAFVLVLLKASVIDSILEDSDSLTTVFSSNPTSGTVEAIFTNYARKIVESASLVALPPPNSLSNNYDIDLPDPRWASAGNGVNDDLVKLLVCFDSDTTGGDDSNIIPCTHYDIAKTTDGGDLVVTFNTLGFFRAS